jgi:hypothetical protein
MAGRTASGHACFCFPNGQWKNNCFSRELPVAAAVLAGTVGGRDGGGQNSGRARTLLLPKWAMEKQLHKQLFYCFSRKLPVAAAVLAGMVGGRQNHERACALLVPN